MSLRTPLATAVLGTFLVAFTWLLTTYLFLFIMPVEPIMIIDFAVWGAFFAALIWLLFFWKMYKMSLRTPLTTAVLGTFLAAFTWSFTTGLLELVGIFLAFMPLPLMIGCIAVLGAFFAALFWLLFFRKRYEMSLRTPLATAVLGAFLLAFTWSLSAGLLHLQASMPLPLLIGCFAVLGAFIAALIWSLFFRKV